MLYQFDMKRYWLPFLQRDLRTFLSWVWSGFSYELKRFSRRMFRWRKFSLEVSSGFESKLEFSPLNILQHTKRDIETLLYWVQTLHYTVIRYTNEEEASRWYKKYQFKTFVDDIQFGRGFLMMKIRFAIAKMLRFQTQLLIHLTNNTSPGRYPRKLHEIPGTPRREINKTTTCWCWQMIFRHDSAIIIVVASCVTHHVNTISRPFQPEIEYCA